jgi:hypothetical protein
LGGVQATDPEALEHAACSLNSASIISIAQLRHNNVLAWWERQASDSHAREIRKRHILKIAIQESFRSTSRP